MNIVRTHIIHEKFVEDEKSDPITDMGIGSITKFKDFLKLFSDIEVNNYVYTIHVDEDFIDFIFNAPKTRKLSKEENDKLFDYVKNIIDELGFSRILINPQTMKFCDNEEKFYHHNNVYYSGAIRFNIINAAKNKIKPASYRNAHGFGFSYYETISKEEYKRGIENFKSGDR